MFLKSVFHYEGFSFKEKTAQFPLFGHLHKKKNKRKKNYKSKNERFKKACEGQDPAGTLISPTLKMQNVLTLGNRIHLSLYLLKP